MAFLISAIIDTIINELLGKKFNKDLSNLYSENKNLSDLIVFIDKKHKQTGLNKLEIARLIGDEEYLLYENYDIIFSNYWNCKYELNAREQGEKTKRKAEYFEKIQKLRQTSYTRQDFIRRIASGRPIFQSSKYDIGRTGSGFIEKGDIDRGSTKENAKEKLISHIPDDIDEILPKVKKPSDKVFQRIITPISTRLESISPRIKHAVRKFELDSALTENKYAETVKPFIDNLSKMSESDYAKYDLALKNGNIEVINKIKC